MQTFAKATVVSCQAVAGNRHKHDEGQLKTNLHAITKIIDLEIKIIWSNSLLYGAG